MSTRITSKAFASLRYAAAPRLITSDATGSQILALGPFSPSSFRLSPANPSSTQQRRGQAEDGFVEEEEYVYVPESKFQGDVEAPHPTAAAEGAIPTAGSTSSTLLNRTKPKIPDGEILSFVDKVLSMTPNAGDVKYNMTPASKRFEKSAMRFVGEHENTVLEVQRLGARYKQQGPFMGSHAKDVQVMDVDRRSRREMVSVPQAEAPFIANETSFRRLPRTFRIPIENELQALYPQNTGMKMIYDEAHCADHDGHNIDDEAPPIRFWKVLPPNFDENKQYPFIVVLADGSGCKEDFADVLANFFERPAFRPGLEEQEFVLLCPEVAVKRSWKSAQEVVVARFCDWVCENFNVENNRVHLFGKGHGAFAALRTCLEQRDVALSCTAILGRGGTPFRLQSGAQEKVKNLQGVHTLMYVPGRMRRQEWAYKFKFMMDYGEVKPPMRSIHFADVSDHQVYYAINPHEFWNHMRYFRQFNSKQLTRDDLFGAASQAASKDEYEPAFSQWEIYSKDVKEEGVVDSNLKEEKERAADRKEAGAGVNGAFSGINVDSPPFEADMAAAGINEKRARRS